MSDKTTDIQLMVEAPALRWASFFTRFWASVTMSPRPVDLVEALPFAPEPAQVELDSLVVDVSGGLLLGSADPDEARTVFADLAEHPHADDCPDCGRDIARQELEWMWQLPLPQLRALLMEGLGHRQGELTGYEWDLRELALNLILDAPMSGPPADPHMFLQSCTRAQLACNWGGSADHHTPWTGVPGVDVLIVAATSGHPCPVELVAAEFFNLMRDWAADPSAARRMAEYVGIDADKLPLSR
jgi:hypothetical protein